IPVFMFDSMLNSGILIANNSFMIKHSPRDQRAMFIAAGNAFAGMVGGTASVVSGYWLRSMADWSCVWNGKLLVGYHVLFAISLGLRLVAAVLAQMLREPSASPTPEVLNQIAART